ncbi:hypothetical protein CHL10075_09130 [Campylobacter hyointestinalis subsp. lawsonii]|nr:hypothetical protein CHL10075_09130 [Campylobacter hyointestinalis subsp. lawsonii]
MMILKELYIMINDFFTHPMRIFFLLLSLFCVLSSFIFFTNLDFITIHKTLFIGVIPCVAYCGFLLTAFPDWTKFNKNLKPHTIILFCILNLAFLSAFFNPFLANLFVAFAWTYIFILSTFMTIQGKNSDQLSIHLLLFLFAVFSFLYAFSTDEKYLHLEIFLHFIGIFIISFRISIVLGKEALVQGGDEISVFIPNLIYKNLAIIMIYVYIICVLADFDKKTLGFILLGIGSATLAKLAELHYQILLKRYFILVYYFLQLTLGTGFIWLGISYLFELTSSADALHIITISGIFGAIYMVINIAGLRHSGFNGLKFDLDIKFGFICIFVGSICRAVFGQFSIVFLLYIPAILLATAFIIYGFKFYHIFKTTKFSEDPD